MADQSAVCSETFFAEKWKNWCRLCAKDATEYVTVISSSHALEPMTENALKSDVDLAHVILEFFRIHIKEDDKLPQIICTVCHGVVISLIKFSERANKVQQMYSDLQSMQDKSSLNLEKLLENYGIFEDESFVPQNDIELPVEQIFVAGLADTTPTMPIRKESATQKENFSVQQLEVIQKNEDANDYHDPICGEDKDINHDSYLPSADTDGLSSDSDYSDESDDSDDSYVDSKPTKSKGKAKRKTTATSESKSPPESSVTCKLCSKNFQRRCNYSRHMKIKHGVLSCKQCPSSFTTAFLLKRHMKEHKRLFNCEYCEQVFERKGLASQHMKMEHKDEIKRNSKNNKTSFVCESCGEALPTQKKLQQHMLTHAGGTPIVCKVCGKNFNKRLQLQRHMQKHGDKYICTECGKQLSCRAALHSHKLVHSDTLKHKCDYCGHAFKRARALKYHILAHTGLRPYSCDFCEKTFSTGSSCRLHKKTMHPVELAEWEASGAIAYTKNVPNLNELREIARAGKNLQPLMSKQNGYINPQNTKELQPNDNAKNV